jgi:hypothetical protein
LIVVFSDLVIVVAPERVARHSIRNNRLIEPKRLVDANDVDAVGVTVETVRRLHGCALHAGRSAGAAAGNGGFQVDVEMSVGSVCR